MPKARKKAEPSAEKDAKPYAWMLDVPQMSVKNISKIDLKTRDSTNKQQPKRQSKFESTELFAERILALERRVDELERKLR